MSAPTGTVEGWQPWVEEVLGRSDVVLARRTGGGRHGAWDVRVGPDGDDGRYFLRADDGPARAAEHYTLRREARIYRALHGAGLRVPAVVGLHPDDEAVVLEAMPGVAALPPSGDPARRAVLEDLIDRLADLHRLDPRALDLTGDLVPATTAAHVTEELDRWELRLDRTLVGDPLAAAAFAWLRTHVPAMPDAPSVVQGDAGPGNFLHDGRQVTALLDFELAHLGDPLEDLAWIAVRSIQDPIDDYGRLLRRYARVGPTPIDAARLRYHQVFAVARIVVLDTEHRSVGIHHDPNAANLLIFGAAYRRVLFEVLAAAMTGEVPEVVAPVRPETPDTAYFDGALAQLRDVVAPSVQDRFARSQLGAVARLVKILRDADRFGPAADAAELGALADLLGSAPKDLAEGRRRLHERIVAHQVAAGPLLALLRLQAGWDLARYGSAMGALATRHLPAVEPDRGEEPDRGA